MLDLIKVEQFNNKVIMPKEDFEKSPTTLCAFS